MNDPLLLCITRPDVEAGNLTPFLRRFDRKVLPRNRKLARMMGTFSFFVDGYNGDPDEIYSIQAVRDYYQSLDVRWPYWFFFCDLRNESLKMIVACLMQNVAAHKTLGARSASVELDPLELLAFVLAGFSPMNEMFDRADMSEFEIWKRTKAIFDYFDFPFDAPSPR